MKPGRTRTGGRDALCFTAGPKGAFFGIGVIHAWLAADRNPPEAAAGISTGALTATAMHYSYRALENGDPACDLEVRRWTWFRRYLATMSSSPLDVIWKAIPDPVDFFADKPPVKDLSCPAELKEEEAEARRNYYVLTRLGGWLGGLPLKVSRIATCAVSYVRWKEDYGSVIPLMMRLWFYVNVTVITLQLLTMLCLPYFFSEHTFRVFAPTPPRRSGLGKRARAFLKRGLATAWSWRIRPLFGWRVWMGALAATALLIYITVGSVFRWALYFFPSLDYMIGWTTPAAESLVWKTGCWISLIATITLLAVLMWTPLRRKASDWLMQFLLEGLGLERGFLHDYHFHRSLLELFADEPSNPTEPVLTDKPFHLILVAAALQDVRWNGHPLKSQQVWAELGTKLTVALRGALRITGLFPPLHLNKRKDIGQWVEPEGTPELDLVDGAGISQNPVTALCGWFHDHPDIARKLCATSPSDRRVHVVHSVPIEPYGAGAKRPESINIVESATISRELERRRDTNQEARQANFMSEMELNLPPKEKKHPLNQGPRTLFTIFVDEIAPRQDIAFANNLDPTADEIRAAAAAGCRQTLESLYRDQLSSWRGEPVPCHELLKRLAPERQPHMTDEAPGVRELCVNCTRLLQFRPSGEEHAQPVYRSYGQDSEAPALLPAFQHLRGEEQRIVFLGSGGVFRGSFHTGVVAAMHSLRIKPDLIVGASVGALMGGALGAISTLPSKESSLLLKELCDTFLCVDRKVSLTRTLKNTMKQLGVRARRIDLSPRILRRMMRRGGRGDAGFAAVGAPPALIDAISDLFLIPRSRTRSIASEFVAGHMSRAANRFWKQVEKETLPSLDIETFLMGTSLLEPLARKLLGGDFGLPLNTSQPYHRGAHPISFFCTTSDLYLRRSFVLGRDFLQTGNFMSSPGSYDFVNAALCSSAFPVVFAPRSEAQVIPGRGRTDVLLADGGMFDNLPFLPAIEILQEIQTEYRVTQLQGETPEETARQALDFLKRRQERPTLIISAALDADRCSAKNSNLRSLRGILERVSSLAKNVKGHSFEGTSERVGVQVDELVRRKVEDLLSRPDADAAELTAFMDSTVPSGVLQITPTDKAHINGTFSFCRSVGMEKKRVQRSIADGCFQTMRSLALASGKEGLLRKNRKMLDSAIGGLVEAQRIPLVRIRPAEEAPASSECRYFEERRPSGSWKPVVCPFAICAGEDKNVAKIWQVCVDDRDHQKLVSVPPDASVEPPQDDGGGLTALHTALTEFQGSTTLPKRKRHAQTKP